MDVEFVSIFIDSLLSFFFFFFDRWFSFRGHFRTGLPNEHHLGTFASMLTQKHPPRSTKHSNLTKSQARRSLVGGRRVDGHVVDKQQCWTVSRVLNKTPDTGQDARIHTQAGTRVRKKRKKKEEKKAKTISVFSPQIICLSFGPKCCSVARCFIPETFTCTTSGPASPKCPVWMGFLQNSPPAAQVAPVPV